MQKDFSYPLKIDALNQQQQHFKLRPDAAQLVALAQILKVEDVKSFSADIFAKLNIRAHSLEVWGEVKAELVLQSVISLENFVQSYHVPFEYHFDTKATYKDIREMEPSIDDDVPDIIENGQIDLAELAIEQLALSIDDYPRKEGEKFTFVSEFDEETTVQAHPFAILKKLKK